MKNVVLAVVLVVLAGTAEAELFLPPAGEDVLPATSADLQVELFEGGTQDIGCSGPTQIVRSDPVGGVIQTEILSMSLTCSNGIKVNQDPARPSRGQIMATGESFFDVFVVIDGPFGRLTNSEPARVQSTIAHIPPLGSIYFGVRPVSLVTGSTIVGRLLHFAHRTNGVPKPESSGEFSRILSCFYECKMQRTSTGALRWREVTSLLLLNQSVKQPITADILFVDGHERPLARSRTPLSPLDVDEINVCTTLDNAGLFPVPAAAGHAALVGVIEVLLSPTGGAYGWMKNASSNNIPREQDEFLQSNLTGLGKTECRLVGPNVVTPPELERVLAAVPAIPPVYIENTGE